MGHKDHVSVDWGGTWQKGRFSARWRQPFWGDMRIFQVFIFRAEMRYVPRKHCSGKFKLRIQPGPGISALRFSLQACRRSLSRELLAKRLAACGNGNNFIVHAPTVRPNSGWGPAGPQPMPAAEALWLSGRRAFYRFSGRTPFWVWQARQPPLVWAVPMSA